MKTLLQVLLILSISGALMACQQKKWPQVNTKPMPDVDLSRYMGTWYEIARFPNRFEEGLDRVTAQYSLKENGRVKIINTGYTEDDIEEVAYGEAYVPHPRQSGHLRVSFVYPYRWFYGSYNILHVNADYSLALVSGDDAEYLWILARTPSINHAELHDLLGMARARGFDTQRLYYTKQQ